MRLGILRIRARKILILFTCRFFIPHTVKGSNLSTLQTGLPHSSASRQMSNVMSLIKVICFFNLATSLGLISSKDVAANPLISGPFLGNPSPGNLLISTRVLEGSGDCHCDGTIVHCSNEVEEGFCSCANETVSCTDPFEGCHCDGSDVHCTNSAVEPACHCDDGAVHCE